MATSPTVVPDLTVIPGLTVIPAKAGIQVVEPNTLMRTHFRKSSASGCGTLRLGRIVGDPSQKGSNHDDPQILKILLPTFLVYVPISPAGEIVRTRYAVAPVPCKRSATPIRSLSVDGMQ